MRVTAKKKEATRLKVLEVAQGLFKSRGFHETTARDLAAGVGVAAGTIFNYFPSKEAIVLQLMADRLERATKSFERRSRDAATLEEDVFLFISTGLRELKPLRSFISPVLESHLGPTCGSDANENDIRASHLEFVCTLFAGHGRTEPLSATQLQMYWLIYAGVLAFWARDSSRKQEDTLALLDQSLNMFLTWLDAN